MKTIFKTAQKNTKAGAMEFQDFMAALHFIQEKKRQGYTTTFPSLHNRIYVVYAWRQKK